MSSPKLIIKALVPHWQALQSWMTNLTINNPTGLKNFCYDVCNIYLSGFRRVNKRFISFIWGDLLLPIADFGKDVKLALASVLLQNVYREEEVEHYKI